MNSRPIAGPESGFAMLRRFSQRRAAAEQCEFCSVELAPGHRHLVEIATPKIICACQPCALRFENAVGRWKLVPRDPRALPEFQITDAEWDSLALPINLAFFLYSTPAGKVTAMYPSPAGATESLLPLSRWEALVAANPSLARLEPDVEALLANRLAPAPEYYVAPIDLCFELVGLIRLHWRGLSGGEKVAREIETFFANLRTQARRPGLSAAIATEAAHA